MIKLKKLLLELKNTAEIGNQFSDPKTGKLYIIVDISGDKIYTMTDNQKDGPIFSKKDLEFKAGTNLISFENPEKLYYSDTKYGKALDRRAKSKEYAKTSSYTDSQYYAKVKKLAKQIHREEGVSDEDIFDNLVDLAQQYVDDDPKLKAYLYKNDLDLYSLADTIFIELK